MFRETKVAILKISIAVLALFFNSAVNAQTSTINPFTLEPSRSFGCGDGVCQNQHGENEENCLTDCPAVCGNGIVAPGEACDDGNTIEGDGCSNSCLLEKAVIGIVLKGKVINQLFLGKTAILTATVSNTGTLTKKNVGAVLTIDSATHLGTKISANSSMGQCKLTVNPFGLPFYSGTHLALVCNLGDLEPNEKAILSFSAPFLRSTGSINAVSWSDDAGVLESNSLSPVLQGSGGDFNDYTEFTLAF